MKCTDCSQRFRSFRSCNAHKAWCINKQILVRNKNEDHKKNTNEFPVAASVNFGTTIAINIDNEDSSTDDELDNYSVDDNIIPNDDNEENADNVGDNIIPNYNNEDNIKSPLEGRWIPKSEMDLSNDSLMHYYNKQTLFAKTLYGSATNAETWREFKHKMDAEHNDADQSSARTALWLRVIQFGIESGISRAAGDALLTLINECRQTENVAIPLPKSWKTLSRFYTQETKHYDILTKEVPYPKEWQVDKWRFKPKPIKVSMRDPIEMIGQFLMSPSTAFGWRNHLQLTAWKKDILDANDNNERAYGDIMSSIWAEKTERELLDRTTEPSKRATLFPVILNSDGVALGDTNRQATTALGALGNCSSKLMDNPLSKFCLGYIPKLGFSKEEIVSNLTAKGIGMNKTQAGEWYTYFEHVIERYFWTGIINTIRNANKNGVYLQVLGEPDHVLLVFPYLIAHVGDEPGQKRMVGMFEGNAKFFCTHCEYKMIDGIYNPTIHLKRDATNLATICKVAQIAKEKYLRRGLEGFVTVTSREDDAFESLLKKGIHPWTNPLHKAPMGYDNSIFMTPYDILHTLCAGVMKNVMLFTCTIIDQISMGDNIAYKQSKGQFDFFLRTFPKQPDCLPHVPQTSFPNGFLHVLSSKSTHEKGLSSGTSGRLRSTYFTTLLLQTYFAIGPGGNVLPNEENYK